jgi:CHAT domain-containing protein
LSDQQPADQPDLLAWCAILRRFDAATLIELAGAVPDAVQSLLTGDQVELDDNAQLFRLRDDLHHAALAKLRRQHRHAENAMHARAFQAFLQRMQQTAAQGWPQTDEDSCFEHLAALHDLSIEYMNWNAIIPYVDALCKIGVQGRAYLRWLEFYQAYIAIRTDRLDEGVARLETLLRLPELEPALRMRVLHACGMGFAYVRVEEALRLYHEAYYLAQQHGNLFRQAYLLLSIGQIYNDIDDYQQALDYSRRSLDLCRRIGAVYREAHALYEIGNNAMRLGDWEQAREALDESAAIYTALDIPTRMSMPYWAQGMVYQMLGDDAQSEAAYQRTLAASLTPTYTNPSNAMDSLAQLGVLYHVQERYDEAHAAYTRAIELAEQYNYRHWFAMYRYWLADLQHQRGDLQAAAAAYREAIDAVEAMRSNTELEALKLSLLGTTQYIYEAMVLFCLKHATTAAAFEYVERARARAFLDLLAKQSPDLYASFDQPTVTLAEVQAQLAEGDLLLEYFTTGMLPLGEHWLNKIPPHNQRLRRRLTPPAQIVIFTITRDACTVHHVAVDPNKLRPSPHSDDPVLQMLRLDATTRWLYDRLIAPIAELLPACRQLYLIPHGPLHYVPFQGLRAPDGTYLLREGGPAIVLAPSATILLRSCLNRARSYAQRCLTIGYNDQDGQPLEHAETEARVIAQLIGGEHWTGPDSKTARLIQAGPELRWLHIAGHASYDHQAALTSSLRLGASDILDASTIMSSLKLGAELVTLSSCMSGFSRVVPGDE